MAQIQNINKFKAKGIPKSHLIPFIVMHSTKPLTIAKEIDFMTRKRSISRSKRCTSRHKIETKCEYELTKTLTSDMTKDNNGIKRALITPRKFEYEGNKNVHQSPSYSPINSMKRALELDNTQRDCEMLEQSFGQNNELSLDTISVTNIESNDPLIIELEKL